MKFKIKGSILFLIIQLIYSVHSRTVNKYLIEDNLQPINFGHNNDQNDIIKRIDESNKYHRNINELEFDYFNMLTNRKKKSQTVKDNEFNFLKNQLIKPPYMYTNYNHQSNLEDQSNDQLNADKDQFINNQLEENNDKLINIDKLDTEQSINKTAPTNQTITEQQQKKKNWFIRVINKLKLGWRLNLNSNLNTTNSTATKEKLKYYEDYDAMNGAKIAYTLFSLFTIFTLFVTYKSYRNSRKQARHRKESEKKRRAEDNEQTTGSRRSNVHVPPKFNSIHGSSGRMSSKTFVKLKTNKEEDFN